VKTKYFVESEKASKVVIDVSNKYEIDLMKITKANQIDDLLDEFNKKEGERVRKRSII